MKKLKSSILMLVLGVLLIPMLWGTKVSAAANVREGIDVSGFSNNGGTIDWSKVKASGKSFVFLRCGYRGPSDTELCRDSYLEKNLQGALDAGLDVGVYFATQALNEAEAREEAEFATELVNKVLSKNASYKLNLPFVVDFEAPSGPKNTRHELNPMTKAQYTAICQAFCEKVQEKGFKAGYYTSKEHLETYFDHAMLSSKYQFWYARYGVSNLDKDHVTYWQYQNGATVAGVPGKADLNRQYIYSPNYVQADERWQNTYVHWDKVPWVDGYEVYRKSNKNGWEEKVATLDGANSTWFDDYNVENGFTYTYRVRAFIKTNSGNWYSPFTGEATRTHGSFSISLNANGGKIASGNVNSYVYGNTVYLPKNMQRKGYTFDGWYTNKKCTKGYTKKINYNDYGNKKFYAKWTKINLATPNIKSVKNNKKKQIDVALKKKVKNADGYVIKYSTKSNMKGAKEAWVTKASTLNKSIKKLQKGKTYYIEVRAYKKDSTGKTIYSNKQRKTIRINK